MVVVMDGRLESDDNASIIIYHPASASISFELKDCWIFQLAHCVESLL